MCSSSYKSCELKINLRWVGTRKGKSVHFFVTFILYERHFFNIWVLDQCIVFRINFQNIYTFTYQKTLLQILLLLVIKIVESLQYILKPAF